ncbi:transcription factor GTE11-like [Brassica rapa]|uniref:transcription factor GTE11-like n=1 Tax=Brassica campestris TaxID=3711 RepID=UPI00142D9F11|nr:transcription factor GTE11-like [Brassica rapa]
MEDEDVDIGYNEQPISRISPVRTHKDKAVGNSTHVKSVPRLLSSPELIQGPSMRGIGVAFEWSDNQFPKEKTSSSQWIG